MLRDLGFTILHGQLDTLPANIAGNPPGFTPKRKQGVAGGILGMPDKPHRFCPIPGGSHIPGFVLGIVEMATQSRLFAIFIKGEIVLPTLLPGQVFKPSFSQYWGKGGISVAL